MTGRRVSLFALIALLGAGLTSAPSARAAQGPWSGTFHGDLGVTGCFFYGTPSGQPSWRVGCLTAVRSLDGRSVSVVFQPVARRLVALTSDNGLVGVKAQQGDPPVYASLPGSALRRGASPQNYWSILLDGDIPGVGPVSLHTNDSPGASAAHTNAPCFADVPFLVTLESPAVGAFGFEFGGFVAGARVVPHSCRNLAFEGETFGQWVMS